MPSSTTYYPFGMESRSVSSEAYRFGFQGQEKDPEWTGQQGSHLAFKYRIHDARIGRFLSIDPLTAKYPHYSPYSFSGNKLIAYREIEGLEESYAMQTSMGADSYLELQSEVNTNAAHFVSEVGRGTANALLMAGGLIQIFAGNASNGFSNDKPYPKWAVPRQLDDSWSFVRKDSWVDRTALSNEDACEIGSNTLTLLTLFYPITDEPVSGFVITSIPATGGSMLLDEANKSNSESSTSTDDNQTDSKQNNESETEGSTTERRDRHNKLRKRREQLRLKYKRSHTGENRENSEAPQ